MVAKGAVREGTGRSTSEPLQRNQRGYALDSDEVSSLRRLDHVHIGRQAIYDTQLQSWAYEVFYRGAKDSGADDDADVATSSVVLSVFAELGLTRVAGNKKVFVNATRGTISGRIELPVPAGRVALQVKSAEHDSAELRQAFVDRKREGFALCLEDFVYDPKSASLLDLVDYVKLDSARLGLDGLRDQMNLLAPHQPTLVVTKVEEQGMFQQCQRLGYRNFQGCLLFRPQVLQHRRLSGSLTVVSQLLTELRKPNFDLGRIEAMVKRDSGLTVSVLRFVASASFGLRYPVSSVGQAITLLGLLDFTKWLTLLALAGVRGKPSEVMLAALVRARASELLAQRTLADEVLANSAFLAGLLSLLDVLLGQPLNRVVQDFPVSEEMARALLERRGTLGEILDSVHSCEDPSVQPKHDGALVNAAWLEAVHWAEDVQRSLET